ncbi:MAG: YhbY family RNA-binding protein [Candidatus Nanoarchaeia archaeon]|nr:YhbY family RNA-binding protein [Candidatus Nanoarchaeia archaeon]MDD5740946.1 YhbY family RNA-binding protein [Candidatus Nanoarchaeia archaeon]
MVQVQMQIGKNRLTPEFIKDIERRLEKYRNAVVKISVLKSARENKGDVKKYAEELLDNLGPNYTAKTMGFTITLRKWRKVRIKE